MAKTHLLDPHPGPGWRGVPYRGSPKGLCGSKAGLSDDASKVTCVTCLTLYRNQRTDAFNHLREAILKQIITRKEYENFWDEVLVSQVMDA